MAAKLCGCACVVALGSEAAPPQHLMRVFGHWSLSHSIPCPCAWVHYGFWLFYAALANSEPSSQPLSAMSTTLSGTKNILWALLWAAGDSKLSDPFLPGCHLCFTTVPMCPGSLLHAQASCWSKAQIVPALGTLQTKMSILSSSPKA